MQNKKSVAILLSTYNGERYLSEQIDSILNQSCQDFTLYIRDDGSNDATMEIVQSYTSQHNNIVIVNSTKNLGCTKSFLTLLFEIESCYYMFCDQDDIWLKDKIKDSLKCIKEEEKLHPGKPAIVYTDLTAVDGDLKVICPSMWEFRGHQERLPHSFNYICHFHDIDGCTMMFNFEAKRLLQMVSIEQVPSFMYHDWLLAVIVSKANGVVRPFDKQTMLFRRHGDNETNALEKSRGAKGTLKHISTYIRIQYGRYLFFHSIGYNNLLTFFFFKVLYIIKRRYIK